MKNSRDLSSHLTRIRPLTSVLSGGDLMTPVGSSSASGIDCDPETCIVSPATAKRFFGKPSLLADLTPATEGMRVVAIGSSTSARIGATGVITLLQPTSQLFVKWDVTGKIQLIDRQKLVPEDKCPAGLVRNDTIAFICHYWVMWRLILTVVDTVRGSKVEGGSDIGGRYHPRASTPCFWQKGWMDHNEDDLILAEIRTTYTLVGIRSVDYC